MMYALARSNFPASISLCSTMSWISSTSRRGTVAALHIGDDGFNGGGVDPRGLLHGGVGL